MENVVMMKCGHASNSKKILDDGTKVNSCIICRCTEEAESLPSLEGRVAVCGQHKGGNPKEVESSWKLPFFEYRPDKENDTYYCGCWGWD